MAAILRPKPYLRNYWEYYLKCDIDT